MRKPQHRSSTEFLWRDDTQWTGVPSIATRGIAPSTPFEWRMIVRTPLVRGEQADKGARGALAERASRTLRFDVLNQTMARRRISNGMIQARERIRPRLLVQDQLVVLGESQAIHFFAMSDANLTHPIQQFRGVDHGNGRCRRPQGRGVCMGIVL